MLLKVVPLRTPVFRFSDIPESALPLTDQVLLLPPPDAVKVKVNGWPVMSVAGMISGTSI